MVEPRSMPSPFVHSILPATCLLSVCTKLTRVQTTRLVFTSILLANSPDLDILPALFFKDYFALIHRGLGHNIFSILGLSILGAWLIRKYLGEIFTERKAFWVSLALVSSHIFLDATAQHNLHGDHPSVPLFWPFSNLAYTIPIKVFDTLDLGVDAQIVSLPFQLLGQSIFWKELILGEILPSLFLFCLFWIGVEWVQWARLRMKSFEFKFFRAYRYGERETQDDLSVG